ncbi:MAG TPA: ABC transporter permease [Candidatus Limnocylindria bacterium]|jgi:peptide/nickel transport system permease protein|nr:ABC transporter permease [Candidatus Limnocylindria bacterium]
MSVAAVARPTMRARLTGPLASVAEFLRLLSRKPLGLVGLGGVLFFLVLAFIVPIFVPYQDTVDVKAIYQPPSAAHPLGTDSSGRDVWNQIIDGGRDILVVGFVAGFFSTLIAVSFGSLAAVVGGKVDSLIAGAADFWLTIPHIPIIVLLGSILKFNSIFVIAALLALLAWAGLLRQVRAQVLSLKERDYVEAARSLDLGLFHIIFKEILPNMRSYIAIHFILAMTAAIYGVAGLTLLGLIPLSGRNWGLMLNFAYVRGALYFRDSLWYILSPVLAIALFQLSLVWLASALEDIFNPRLRSSG